MTTAIGRQFEDFGNGIWNGIQTVVKRTSQVQGNAPTLLRIFRIVGYALAHLSSDHERFQNTISVTDDFVDNFQGFNALHSLVNPKKESQTIFNKVGNAFFVGASTGATGMWLESCGVFSFTKVAASTGNLINKSSVSTAVRGTAAVGYSLMAADSASKLHTATKQLCKAENAAEKTRAHLKISQSWIDIAWMVSEAALKVLLIVGIASTRALLGVGVFAASLGICSFLYSTHANEVVKTLE